MDFWEEAKVFLVRMEEEEEDDDDEEGLFVVGTVKESQWPNRFSSESNEPNVTRAHIRMTIQRVLWLPPLLHGEDAGDERDDILFCL
jgi:hypothetical protein